MSLLLSMRNLPLSLVHFLLLLLACVASAGAQAAEKAPLQTPYLRIEATMHTAILKRAGINDAGTLLVTGSDDKTVRLWTLPDGKLQKVLRMPIGPGHDGKVYAVAMSPDGQYVAAGGWDAAYRILGAGQNYVYVFDTQTGSIVRRLGPLPDVINEIAFSRDGSLIAAGLGGRSGIRIWRTSNWSELASDPSIAGPVYGLSFGPRNQLAVTSYDGHVRLYGADGSLLKKVKAPGGKLPFGNAFSPDGTELAVGYSDSTNVSILSGSTLRLFLSADNSGLNNGDLSSVAWSADGATLYGAGAYDLKGNNPIVRWLDKGRGQRDLLMSPTDTVFDLHPYGRDSILWIAGDPAIGIFDVNGKAAFYKGPDTVDMRSKLGEHFTISPDAQRLRFGFKYGSNDPWLFDLKKLSLRRATKPIPGMMQADIDTLNIANWEDRRNPTIDGKPLELEQHEAARSLAIGPDGNTFYVGADWHVRRYDRTGKVDWERDSPGAVWGVNLSADGRILIAAYGDGTIRWHRASDGTELLALYVQPSTKQWVVWTPKGYYAASPGGESLIGWHLNRTWDESADFFPASRFRAQLYRPDIATLVLATLDEEEAIERANTISDRGRAEEDIRKQLPPTVRIVSPDGGSEFSKQKVEIAYQVASPSGLPVENIDVLIDGRRRALGPKGPVVPSGPGTDFSGKFTIELPNHDVDLSLIARTSAAFSEPVSVSLRWAGSGGGEKPPIQQPFLRVETGMHTGLAKRLGISDDGKWLVTGSEDKTLRVWALPQNFRKGAREEARLVRILRVPIGPGHDGKLYSADLSPDGRYAAAGGWDAAYRILGAGQNYVHVFDPHTGKLLKRLGPLPDVINEIEFSRDGKLIAAALGGNSGVYMFRTGGDWGLVGHDKDYTDQTYGLSFGPDNRLAVASYDGYARVYDADMNLLKKVAGPGGKQPFGVAFSPSGDELALAYSDTTNVDVLDARTLLRKHKVDTSGADNGDLSKVAWSRDGSYLYAAGVFDQDGYNPILRWSKAGRGERIVLKKPTDTVFDMAPHGDKGIIFIAGDPALGILDAKGNVVMYNGPDTVDMRNKLRGNFMVSRDTLRVRFGLAAGGDKPWLFDLRNLTLIESPQAPNDLIQANIDSLPLTNWEDRSNPAVNGKPLAISAYETARSLAIAPDAGSFLVGADWALRRYRDDGELIWAEDVPGGVWGLNMSGDGKIAVAAVADGTIRWYRAEDGKELLALFVQPSTKEWVAWTPTGYYAASPGGAALIGWHVNRGWDEAPDFYKVDRFREQFYRPDIVTLVLAMADESGAIEAANREHGATRGEEDIRSLAPPIITIHSPVEGKSVEQSIITLEYSVRSPSGEKVTDVEVRIDGELQGTRGAVPLADETEDRISLQVQVPGRDVKITLTAKAGDAVSEPASIFVKWAGEKPQDVRKPRLFALIVGVSDYANDSLDLSFAHRDAQDVKTFFEQQNGTSYSEVEFKMLLNRDATRVAILEGLEWLEQVPAQGDVAMIFFAGHGVTDKAGRFFFLPSDADPARRRSTGISGNDLLALLQVIQSKVIILMDVCHGGDGIASRASGRGPADMSGVAGELTAAHLGAAMFASSAGRQFSHEHQKWENGAFTEALLEALGGLADYNRNGAIETWELNGYLGQRVPELVNSVRRGPQTPLHHKSRALPDFTLARLG